MALKLLVGLGNPGPKYHWTRHNAGFMVLDRLAHEAGISMSRKAFSGLCGEGSWQGERLVLLEPQTFMNLSGRSVAAAARFHKIDSGDIVVIHDDLDIPFGRVKVKEGGGHGGHNGLRSLMAEMGNGDFVRVRVGIGRPLHGNPVDYVLQTFSKEEQGNLLHLLDGVVDLLEVLLTEGAPKAMSLYNNKDLLV